MMNDSGHVGSAEQALVNEARSGLHPTGFDPSCGRMFVCGDIHGCVEALMAALEGAGFDKDNDQLFALGDLVDRGPDSVGAMMLLKEPWFNSIQGNHEVMMILSADPSNTDAQEMHYINGGQWFAALDQTERDELAAMAAELPVAMDVRTPTGRRIGLVHADLPGADWDEFMARIGEQSVVDYAQWARERVRNAATGGLAPIRGVDHVYFGHTPTKAPLRSANMSWIDTGCFATGKITVEELL